MSGEDPKKPGTSESGYNITNDVGDTSDYAAYNNITLMPKSDRDRPAEAGSNYLQLQKNKRETLDFALGVVKDVDNKPNPAKYKDNTYPDQYHENRLKLINLQQKVEQPSRQSNSDDEAMEINAKPVIVNQNYQNEASLDASTTKSDKPLSDDDLTRAIDLLTEINDNRLGIIWRRPDPARAPPILVRDARAATLNAEELSTEHGEPYAIQILNEVRGAILLLEAKYPDANDPLRKEAEKRLRDIAEHALKHVDQLDGKNVKKYNSRIMFYLEEAKIHDSKLDKSRKPQMFINKKITKDIEKKLKFAKEMANLQDEHRNIVTITEAENDKGKLHAVCQAEVMLNGLSEIQREEYEAIAAIGDERPLKKVGIAWFDHQPEHQKLIILKYARIIAEGKKVLPTQLLSELSGLRNAYQKVTTTIAPNSDPNKMQHEVQNVTTHSGTPTTNFKYDYKKDTAEYSKQKLERMRQRVTNNNIAQYQSYLESDEVELVLNNLTSETNAAVDLKRNENYISEQLRNQGNAKVSVFKSSVNRWQNVNSDSGYDKEFVNGILSMVKSDLTKLSKESFTNDVKNFSYTAIYTVLMNRIESLNSLSPIELERIMYQARLDIINLRDNGHVQLANYLETALEIKQLRYTSNYSSDDNVALNISAKIQILMQTRDKLIEKEKLAEPEQQVDDEAQDVTENKAENKSSLKQVAIAFAVFCKSGKDRTGYVLLKISNMAVCLGLKVPPNSAAGKRNLLKQEAGGHTKFMAGTQGGSMGAFGLKLNPEFGLSKVDSFLEKISGRETAKNNNIKHDDDYLSKLRQQRDIHKLKEIPAVAVKKVENVANAALQQPAPPQDTKRKQFTPPPLTELVAPKKPGFLKEFSAKLKAAKESVARPTGFFQNLRDEFKAKENPQKADATFTASNNNTRVQKTTTKHTTTKH